MRRGIDVAIELRCAIEQSQRAARERGVPVWVPLLTKRLQKHRWWPRRPTTPDADPWPFFELVDVRVTDTVITAILHDPAGRTIGWRWPLVDHEGHDRREDPVWLIQVATTNLEEDAVTSTPGEPDGEGVRWLSA